MAGQLQRFTNGKSRARLRVQIGAMIAPSNELVRIGLVFAVVRNALTDQEREMSFESEDVVVMTEAMSGEHAGSVLPVKVDERLDSSQRRFGATHSPKRRIQPVIEPIMQRQKIARLGPNIGDQLVVGRT